MAEQITLDYKNKEVQRFLEGMIRNLKNVKNKDRKFISNILSIHVFKDVIDHFEKESGPKGKWQKWSKSYKDQLAGKIYFRTLNGNKIPFEGQDPKRTTKPDRILQDSGNLRQNFKPINWRPDRKGIAWFNNAKTKSGFPYAYAHDNYTAPRTILPQRQFMWLSEKALTNMGKDTLSYIVEEK